MYGDSFEKIASLVKYQQLNDNYEIEVDRKIAIKMAFDRFNTNSIILVAGKGHEKYQIIGDKSLPHDDKEVIKKLIL